MKKALVFFATLGLSFGADQVILKKPPASLGKYYPPQSNKFEYVSVMHEMSTAFYGVRLNINEGKWDKALDWANRLKDAYTRAQNMVPEWKDYFKPALVDQFINAVRSKNPDQVIKASKELGETCAKCHAENQIAVKLVYHYPPFATLKMEDPIEFAQLSPKEYMRKLSDSMKALRIFLLQGDVQKAREVGEQVVERIEEHRVDPEYIKVPKETVDLITETKERGKRVIAVGTTVVRALETKPFEPFEGWTDLYIYPGYQFKVVDGLITNFHLPRSSLLFLVCAFGGREFILSAYKEAVEKRYRFYSYGDGMLIL